VRGGVGSDAVDADRLSGREGGNGTGEESNIGYELVKRKEIQERKRMTVR
jgi:hypothetical protein